MKNKLSNNTEGVGCIILFILPFLLIGIGTLYLSLNTLYLQSKTMNWIAVDALIESVDFITTYGHGADDGITYETKCTYTYIYENKNYSNNIISIGYGSNNTENHKELYKTLQYVNRLTAYINPEKPNDSTLAKGINSSMISLLIFSILWNGLLLVFYKGNKYRIITPLFILVFICGIIIITTGVFHTNFKKKINILEKKSKEEIEQIESELFYKAIEEYEKNK
ncbi:DUF3592 domain-containing protein (plasmid) [Tenacibaculum finnmarkense]|nr:DUF3592 domain-containing protein [Tenacibaculum finnmarkense]